MKTSFDGAVRVVKERFHLQDDDARENLILLRRFENRFPQLALGYIY